MSFKFHWGHSVVLFMGAFMIFILSFVYKTLFVEKYDHQLETKNYYEEELAYQEEVDRINNANLLDENIDIKTSANGLDIEFPNVFFPSKVSGYLKLKKVDDEKQDMKKDIFLKDSVLNIPISELNKGAYQLKVIWIYDGKSYQKDKKIMME